MGKKYWKGLEELNKSQDTLHTREDEFSRDISVDEFLAREENNESSTSRRNFLKFLGFSVAAATVTACETPVTKVVPYVNKPVDVTPGEANWYASTYYDGNNYASILVKTREGRPIYIKGNRDFGFTNGGTNPQILASLLGLYNEERLHFAYKGGKGISTDSVDKEIPKELNKIKAKKGKVVLVSNTIASPSTMDVIDEFRQSITGKSAVSSSTEMEKEGKEGKTPANTPSSNGAQFEHIQYDPISYSGIRKANKLSFGKAVIPDYDFSKAKTIVSFGADFLNSWLLSTEYTPQYGKRRNPDADWMNKHYQVESNMSITGSNADTRLMIKPSEEAGLIAHVIKQLGGSTGGVSPSVPKSVNAKDIEKMVVDLKKGDALVISGSNNIRIQVLINKLNHLLGSYEKTINLNNPISMFASEEDKMLKLIKDVVAGKGPDAIFFYGANPVYSMPNGKKFAAALSKTNLSVSLASFMDETATRCQYVVPDHHALESWNDYRVKPNEYGIAQPSIRPLYDTMQAQESFLVWAGKAQRGGKDSSVYYDIIKENFKKKGLYNGNNFSNFFNKQVYRSVFTLGIAEPSTPKWDSTAFQKAPKTLPKSGDGFEIVFYQKPSIGNGDQAANPWLQEMPDPLSKISWDNYITMNPSYMRKQGYEIFLDQKNGATIGKITVGKITYELPIVPSPGQTSGTVGIALGYGRGEDGEKIGTAAYQTKEYGGYKQDENGQLKPIGENAFRFVQIKGNNLEYTALGSVKGTSGEYPIARTQTASTAMGRTSIIRETTEKIYKNHSREAYNPEWMLEKINKKGETVEAPLAEFDLWDAHPVKYVGHRWGMSVDLNSCIGCGACMIACQAENNVPVVGKDEVRRGREMHWIRIDRYYRAEEEVVVGQGKENFSTYDDGAETPAENPSVVFQPMMCQQCNHAPCETVCPVGATTHSDEGLNQMTYNRCIGTRYCANNCPYKVRRFNWFNYPSYKKFTEVNPAQSEVGRLVLNPDVTVRTRGVMEKCSFCVQRIQTGKLDAKMEGRPVKDSDVTTACQDACPTNAIIVGDWNDPESKVKGLSESKRSYRALEEIGTKPNVWYQTKVRNNENKLLAKIQTHQEELKESEVKEKKTKGKDRLSESKIQY